VAEAYIVETCARIVSCCWFPTVLARDDGIGSLFSVIRRRGSPLLRRRGDCDHAAQAVMLKVLFKL